MVPRMSYVVSLNVLVKPSRLPQKKKARPLNAAAIPAKGTFRPQELVLRARPFSRYFE